MVVADKADFDVVAGDVGNAFPTADTEEKVYFEAGNEFGPSYRGKVVIIVRALYGLASSSSQWHMHFSTTLRDLGFEPTRFDRDCWIREHKDGKTYEYVCSYVDDFILFSKSPYKIMKKLEDVYTIKDIGPPDYYLGNDYKTHRRHYSVGCKKYISHVLPKLRDIHGDFVNRKTPCDKDAHLELDQSPLLSLVQHRQYQQLVLSLIHI